MPNRTPFAGLLRLLAGEPLSTEGYAFSDTDRLVIDRLLQLGARDHRHDEHPALVHSVDPIDPVVALEDTGGTIASDTDIHVGYTLIDALGGETELNATVAMVHTQAGMSDPTQAPSLTLDHTSGDLLADTYYYGVTVTDGAGGESGLSSVATFVVPPGFGNSRLLIADLDDIVATQGGAGWRLWRQVGGGEWALIATGVAASIYDTGLMCVDSGVQPPPAGGFVSTTNNTSVLKVTIPSAGQPTEAVSFSIYASVDGTFGSPSLLGTYPAADLGDEKTYASLTLLSGAPPVVTTAYAGANKIDPDTEMLEFPWKRPVASAAALPDTGNELGDVRLTLDDFVLHGWNGTAWDPLSGSGGGGGGDVEAEESARVAADNALRARIEALEALVGIDAPHPLVTASLLGEFGTVPYGTVVGEYVEHDGSPPSPYDAYEWAELKAPWGTAAMPYIATGVFRTDAAGIPGIIARVGFTWTTDDNPLAATFPSLWADISSGVALTVYSDPYTDGDAHQSTTVGVVLDPDTDYWMRVTYDAPDLTAELWDEDPTLTEPEPTPLYTATDTVEYGTPDPAAAFAAAPDSVVGLSLVTAGDPTHGAVRSLDWVHAS